MFHNSVRGRRGADEDERERDDASEGTVLNM